MILVKTNHPCLWVGHHNSCLKRGELSDHAGVVDGSGSHPRGKGAHHLRWVDDGKAYLDTPRPQKGKLLKLLSALHLEGH
jgi:hypothetical protein